MKLLFYKLLSIRLSNQVQRLLMRIVIESESDPIITDGLKTSELYNRMKHSFNSGLMSLGSLDELMEHYEALKSFKAKLAKRLDEIKNPST